MLIDPAFYEIHKTLSATDQNRKLKRTIKLKTTRDFILLGTETKICYLSLFGASLNISCLVDSITIWNRFALLVKYLEQNEHEPLKPCLGFQVQKPLHPDEMFSKCVRSQAYRYICITNYVCQTNANMNTLSKKCYPAALIANRNYIFELLKYGII